MVSTAFRFPQCRIDWPPIPCVVMPKSGRNLEFQDAVQSLSSLRNRQGLVYTPTLFILVKIGILPRNAILLD